MATRWLDADERRAWIGLLASTTLLEVAMDEQLRRDHGLTHTSYAILAGLSEQKTRTLHMHQLSIMTSHSPSRLSHAIARMEESGWVTRAPCPKNRRAVHATLTDAGFALVEAAAPAHLEVVRRLVFDRLSAIQVTQLGSICATLLDGLAAEGHAVPVVSEQP